MTNLNLFFIFITSCATKVPWGMQEVEKNVGVDDTEISAGEWLEFVCYTDLNYYEKNGNKKIPNSPELNVLKLNSTRLPNLEIIKNMPYYTLFLDSY